MRQEFYRQNYNMTDVCTTFRTIKELGVLQATKLGVPQATKFQHLPLGLVISWINFGLLLIPPTHATQHIPSVLELFCGTVLEESGPSSLAFGSITDLLICERPPTLAFRQLQRGKKIEGKDLIRGASGGARQRAA